MRRGEISPASFIVYYNFVFPRERERSQEGMLSWMRLRLWWRRRMKDSPPPRTPLLKVVQNRTPDGLDHERRNKELLKDRTNVPKITWCNLTADDLKYVANWGKFGLLKIWKTSERQNNYIKSPFPINIRHLKVVCIILYFFHILFIRMVSVSTK